MSEVRLNQMTKWYALLAFAAGSVLSAILAALDRGRGLMDLDRGHGLMDGNSPSVGLLLLGWTVLGIVTGAWIILSYSWKRLAREQRLRLASAYFIVGWGGLFGMSLYTPVLGAVLIAAFIAAAIVFLAHEMEGRQRKQDEGDIFP